jgi:hypothetical protein
MIGGGVAVFNGWWCASPRCYFKRVGQLTPPERDRLNRVLDARREAEDIPEAYGRYLGVAIMAFGALALVPAVPLILPYALFCLALAGSTLLAYLRFRRATQRRVAPLVRRSALRVLSPVPIATVICGFVATLSVAAYPPQRLSAIIALTAIAVLGFVAWRIAEAPALLLGEDPQWEYAVDEHLRICRARQAPFFACATAFVVVGFGYPSLLAGSQPYAAIALNAAYAAAVVSFIAYLWTLFQTVRVNASAPNSR